MSYDLQAAVTSWVAQELELQAPDENIGYWVQLEGQADGLPRVVITLVTGKFEALRSADWPPTQRGPGGVRQAVYRAIQDIRRYCTEKDPE
jgi:hypothetical protein